MKKPLDELIRKSQGEVSRREAPVLPDGFGAKVVAAHGEASAQARAEQVRWLHTAEAGAAVAIAIAATVHFGVDRDSAASAANAWLEMPSHEEGAEP